MSPTRHARAIAKLERVERKLVRAFNEWAKLRLQVRRYDKRADLEFLARASEIVKPRDGR